jgi:adenosylhomocysteine nucleosidase
MRLVIQICSEDEWKHSRSILRVQESELWQDLLMEWFVRPLGKEEYTWYWSGSTKTRAAAACQKAIDRWCPDAIVNLGTCGGISKNIQKLDIVLANKTYQYDVIQRFGKPSKRFLRGLITQPNISGIDLSLVREKCLVGTIASADQDFDPEAIEALRKKHALAADWESASIAKVCELNKTKCLILRGVSDIPRKSRGGKKDIQEEDYQANTPRIMKELFSILQNITFRFRGLKGNRAYWGSGLLC